MANDVFKPLWYVLLTKSRFENVVFDGLLKKKIDVFLPKITVRSKRKDRKQMIQVPLFPGYVFVKSGLTPNEHLAILKTTGAVRLIGSNDGPVSVDERDIESLKIMISSSDEIFTGSRFEKGSEVVVTKGPFTGIKGIFEKYGGKGRVIVNIDALGQFASVDVDEDDVEIVS